MNKGNIVKSIKKNDERRDAELSKLRKIYEFERNAVRARHKAEDERLIKLCEEMGGHEDLGGMFYAQCKHCGVIPEHE